MSDNEQDILNTEVEPNSNSDDEVKEEVEQDSSEVVLEKKESKANIARRNNFAKARANKAKLAKQKKEQKKNTYEFNNETDSSESESSEEELIIRKKQKKPKNVPVYNQSNDEMLLMRKQIQTLEKRLKKNKCYI